MGCCTQRALFVGLLFLSLPCSFFFALFCTGSQRATRIHSTHSSARARPSVVPRCRCLAPLQNAPQWCACNGYSEHEFLALKM